jgi:hypothetical protein
MFRHAVAIAMGEIVKRDGFVFADLLRWRRRSGLRCRRFYPTHEQPPRLRSSKR